MTEALKVAPECDLKPLLVLLRAQIKAAMPMPDALHEALTKLGHGVTFERARSQNRL